MALGNLRRLTGDYPASEQALADALAVSRALKAAGMEAEILNCTGSLHYSRGDLENARACHQSALRRSRHLSVPLEEGRALAGLGRCALSTGDHINALALLQRRRRPLRSHRRCRSGRGRQRTQRASSARWQSSYRQGAPPPGARAHQADQLVENLPQRTHTGVTRYVRIMSQWRLALPSRSASDPA